MDLGLLIIEDYTWLSPLAWYGEKSIYFGGMETLTEWTGGSFKI